MLTKGICVSIVSLEWRNWLIRHDQNGKVVASVIPIVLRSVPKLHPVYSRQLRVTISSSIGIRELQNCFTLRDARMLAYRMQDGGCVVAQRFVVMTKTW
jgi:hypothetical protein